MRPCRTLLVTLVLVSTLSACGRRAPASGPVTLLPHKLPLLLQTSAQAVEAAAAGPYYYTIQTGDTLGGIADRFEVDQEQLAQANNVSDPDAIVVGAQLIIPGRSGRPATAQTSTAVAGSGQAQPKDGPTQTPGTETPTGQPKRGSVAERLTFAAQVAPGNSAYHNKTWVSYYGRPDVPIMGILGEYSIDELIPRLRQQAAAYDKLNGPEIGVMPAFHLIYGMATSAAGADGTHLDYLPDSVVDRYIQRARKEGIGVILDEQVADLTPLASITPSFRWLQYDNVHLALDPEFAMTTEGQEVPGLPPGTVTAEEINEVQAAMSSYMQENGIKGNRILIVHQFLPWMIENKPDLYTYEGVELTVCADGFGEPVVKISKYNDFMDENVPFASFKLFYQWDEPVMTEGEVLGIDEARGVGYIDKTPNLVIYQ